MNEASRSRPTDRGSPGANVEGWQAASPSQAVGQLAALDITSTRLVPRPRNKPRGIPTVLSAHQEFDLQNPEAVERGLQPVLGRVRVVITPEQRREFQMRLHAISLHAVTFAYLDSAGDCSVASIEDRSRLQVIIPTARTAEVRVGNTQVSTSAVVGAVIDPDRSFRLKFDPGLAYVVVSIDRAAIEDRLTRHLGRRLDRPLSFRPRFDLSHQHSVRWNLALQALHAELSEHDSLLEGGVGVAQLEDFILGSLLYCHASNYSASLAGASRSTRRSVRRAVDFIEGRVASQPTVAEIAAAAGVSPRSLQSHFRSDLGHTPLQYLHARRLDRVREDLLDAVPGAGVTVTDVALRWGVRHLGRFSVAYRHRFGESPSSTLRR